MANFRVSTERLVLITGTEEIFRGGVKERTLIERQLEAIVPASWPPEHYEPHVLAFYANILAENPDSVGWTLWYIVLPEDSSGNPVVIGDIGFKGPPGPDGTVEIGYSVLSEYQGEGYATEAVAGLVSWAFSHPMIERVIAETYPELTPSVRVLEKNGFRYIGAGSEERVIRFELTRRVHESAESELANRKGCI